MERMSLPTANRTSEAFGCERLPITDPFVQIVLNFSRPSKKMYVVGRKKVHARLPSICFEPNIAQRRMDLFVSQPRNARSCANGYENESGSFDNLCYASARTCTLWTIDHIYNWNYTSY